MKTWVKTSVLGLTVAIILCVAARAQLNGLIQSTITPAQDSIVQITADAMGLEPVALEDLPRGGTYWWVTPSGAAAPLPFPPMDRVVPIYAITDNQFLVDDTGGQVAVRALRWNVTQSRSSSQTVSAVDRLGNAVADLIEQIQQTQFERSMMMSLGLDVPSPGEGGGGTNSNSFSSFSLPDYGTNLWISQVAFVSGQLVGIATNTQANIRYEIQSRTNLLQTDWQSEGSIYGSETGNWTPLSVPQNGRENLFIRLKSWADSDGSGLPDWWQLQYFGHTGVDPYGNPAGDGWNNLQKFQNGMNPNTFYTPPAPQGVTANLHQISQSATVSWLPSPGAVTGYIVEKTDNILSTVQTFSANTSSFADDLAGNPLDQYWGNNYDVSYRVRALFTNGNSSWSASIPLQQPTVSGSVIDGTNGAAFFTVIGLPTNAVTVQLYYADFSAMLLYNDQSFNFSNDIPASAFVNGVYQIPTSLQPPKTDAYGNADYWIFASSVDANGNASAAQFIGSDLGGTPFHDGRQQLKDNLIFLLRAANTGHAFSYVPTLNGSPYGVVTNPVNYAYSSYCDYFYGKDSNTPFVDNYTYRNFVYDSGLLNSDGSPATGLQGHGDINWLVSPMYFFVPPTNAWTTMTSLTTSNQTRWLAQFPVNYIAGDWHAGLEQIGMVNNSDNSLTMSANVRNVYGLPFLSTLAMTTSPETLLYPGNTTAINNSQNYFYSETAQPQFQTVEYNFWNLNSWTYDPMTQSYSIPPAMPGTPEFSPTNQSQLLVVPVNGTISVAGYAKLAIQNGYSDVYGYLGQYFDQAYKVDTNGTVTATTTGFLTPYGDFFATEPGPVALVTMPDLDTGARGTGMVYCVSLQLDKNHDGNMDLKFNGTDVTSYDSPFVFWRNNNYDRSLYDHDDEVYYEDDLNSIDAGKLPVNQRVPDYDYKDSTSGGRAIPTTRDLEDFARLWICGVNSNMLAALPPNSTVTLSWGDEGNPNAANPTIDLFIAADADGGMGYLTNGTIAANQVSMANGAYGSAYAGRLGPGQSVQLNVARFMQLGNWLGNYFIWCGVSNGTGGLTLTIVDAGGNVLAQTTSYIQIQDIKQMYERWTVGEEPKKEPQTVAVKAVNDLVVNGLIVPFEYEPPQDTNTPYILFVHGWNMRTDDKDRFAETAYKRLYWQGYQGRFGIFRWPTDYDFKGVSDAMLQPHNFDDSEFQAWKSATGLLNKFNNLNATYPGQVYLLAHSMGNVVAGEALRLAGNNQVVNTYVASQAAIPGHVYDASISNPFLLQFTYNNPLVPNILEPSGFDYGPTTPNIYGNLLASNSAAVGRRVNFYNANDFALAAPRWCYDQIRKPDTYGGGFYAYDGSTNDVLPWNHFYYQNIGGGTRIFDIVTNLNNHYEVMAYAAESRSTALGATLGINDFANINLTTKWPSDPFAHGYADHFWHSAEFRGVYWLQQEYWSTLLGTEAFRFK